MAAAECKGREPSVMFGPNARSQTTAGARQTGAPAIKIAALLKLPICLVNVIFATSPGTARPGFLQGDISHDRGRIYACRISLHNTKGWHHIDDSSDQPIIIGVR